MPDITATKPAAGQPIETAWGEQVHNAIESIQYGTVNVTLAAVGNATSAAVVFPRAFTAPPIVVATVYNASTMITGCAGITATQMQVSLRHYDNSSQSVTLPVNWIAIGTLA